MLEERLQQMTPNMAAIDEYKHKEAVYLERLGELNAITGERDEARLEFDRLRKQRLDEFMAGFGVITGKLKEMYQVGVVGWVRLLHQVGCSTSIDLLEGPHAVTTLYEGDRCKGSQGGVWCALCLKLCWLW